MQAERGPRWDTGRRKTNLEKERHIIATSVLLILTLHPFTL